MSSSPRGATVSKLVSSASRLNVMAAPVSAWFSGESFSPAHAPGLPKGGAGSTTPTTSSGSRSRPLWRAKTLADDVAAAPEPPAAPTAEGRGRLWRRRWVLAMAGAAAVIVSLLILVLVLGSGSSAQAAVFRDDFST